MYVVSRQAEPLSSAVMRFQALWIYDLSAYHSFWKESVQTRSSTSSMAWDDFIWKALAKIYGLHLFSPTEALIPFARDYHQHRRHLIGSKNIRDLFASLRRLGLEKIGHLRRLPRSQFQKRFGRAWADFFHGISEPETAEWIWEPLRSQDPLLWSTEFETASVDAGQIVNVICEGLLKISQKSASLRTQKIELQLQLSDPEIILFEFPHPLILQTELGWIRYLITERLHRLSLDAAVWRVSLRIFPSEPSTTAQLSLFQKQKGLADIQRKAFYERLENQGFQIFVPQSEPSYLPEESWGRISPLTKSSEVEFSSHGLFRPLIQLSPQRISSPSGALRFTERISWFDSEGAHHTRDYFVARADRHWIWIFRTQANEWFQQGVVE